MLLACNIGNTEIAFGLYDNDTLLFTVSIATKPLRSADEYAILIEQLFRLHGYAVCDITDVILSPVVPALSETVADAISHFTNVRPMIVGTGMKTGLKIRIDNPSQLGADLVALACGVKQYTDGAAVIASVDAATTLTVLDQSGAVCGVIIMPGIVCGANALERDAAQISQIALKAPRCVIGKTTADAVRSGLFYGCAAQLDGLIPKIAQELSVPEENLSLFVTGKHASDVIALCSHPFFHIPDLLFRGLAALHRRGS